jgi:regulatory LuxR family protein
VAARSRCRLIWTVSAPVGWSWLGEQALDQVVTLVARGASTARIAATLHISEYTVQNHLSHVFEKVGVRDRRALVRRLFLDLLYPSLFG